jgi:hypothetical protein
MARAYARVAESPGEALPRRARNYSCFATGVARPVTGCATVPRSDASEVARSIQVPVGVDPFLRPTRRTSSSRLHRQGFDAPAPTASRGRPVARAAGRGGRPSRACPRSVRRVHRLAKQSNAICSWSQSIMPDAISMNRRRASRSRPSDPSPRSHAPPDGARSAQPFWKRSYGPRGRTGHHPRRNQVCLASAALGGLVHRLLRRRLRRRFLCRSEVPSPCRARLNKVLGECGARFRRQRTALLHNLLGDFLCRLRRCLVRGRWKTTDCRSHVSDLSAIAVTAGGNDGGLVGIVGLDDLYGCVSNCDSVFRHLIPLACDRTTHPNEPVCTIAKDHLSATLLGSFRRREFPGSMTAKRPKGTVETPRND